MMRFTMFSDPLISLLFSKQNQTFGLIMHTMAFLQYWHFAQFSFHEVAGNNRSSRSASRFHSNCHWPRAWRRFQRTRTSRPFAANSLRWPQPVRKKTGFWTRIWEISLVVVWFGTLRFSSFCKVAFTSCRTAGSTCNWSVASTSWRIEARNFGHWSTNLPLWTCSLNMRVWVITREEVQF